LKKMNPLRMPKVGSSSKRARTTSLRYCNRYVWWILNWMPASLISTTWRNLEMSL
jgi:hypothetical protein